MKIYSFTYIKDGKEEVRLISATSRSKAQDFFKDLVKKLTNQKPS